MATINVATISEVHCIRDYLEDKYADRYTPPYLTIVYEVSNYDHSTGARVIDMITIRQILYNLTPEVGRTQYPITYIEPLQ